MGSHSACSTIVSYYLANLGFREPYAQSRCHHSALLALTCMKDMPAAAALIMLGHRFGAGSIKAINQSPLQPHVLPISSFPVFRCVGSQCLDIVAGLRSLPPRLSGRFYLVPTVKAPGAVPPQEIVAQSHTWSIKSSCEQPSPSIAQDGLVIKTSATTSMSAADM